MTLTFDLLTHKADYSMPLLRGSLLPICIEVDLFVFKMCSQVSLCNGQRTER